MESLAPCVAQRQSMGVSFFFQRGSPEREILQDSTVILWASSLIFGYLTHRYFENVDMAILKFIFFCFLFGRSKMEVKRNNYVGTQNRVSTTVVSNHAASTGAINPVIPMSKSKIAAAPVTLLDIDDDDAKHKPVPLRSPTTTAAVAAQTKVTSRNILVARRLSLLNPDNSIQDQTKRPCSRNGARSPLCWQHTAAIHFALGLKSKNADCKIPSLTS